MYRKLGQYGLGLTCCLLVLSISALADRIDPIGTEGFIEGGMIILSHDSGCMLEYCQGGCDKWETGWKCWTNACYSRFDEDWDGLPILVTAVGDCEVVHFWMSYCDDTSSRTGSGTVTASAECWINVIFDGRGMNKGYCGCQEL
jgi:hypothetical protein